MKKTFVLYTLFMQLVFSAAFAQNTIDNLGVTYSYNENDYVISGQTPENLDFSNLTNLDCEVGVQDNQAIVVLYATGQLIIKHRVKTYQVSIDRITNNNATIGSFSVDEEDDDNGWNSLTWKKVTKNGDVYKVTGDDEKYYWAMYQVAKEYEKTEDSEYNFERGSEINSEIVDESGCKIHNDLYYYVTNTSGVKHYYPVIRSILTANPETTFVWQLQDCHINYNISSISSSLQKTDKSINNLTITSSISNICSNAFENCRVGTFVVNNNNNYTDLCSGKVLCRKENGEPVEVLCVAYDPNLNSVNNKLELPASVKKVASNAIANNNNSTNTWFYNVSGAVWFYTPIFIEYNGPKRLGGSNDKTVAKIVHFDHPDVNYNNENISGDIQDYVKLSSKGNTAYYLENAFLTDDEGNVIIPVVTPTQLQEFFSTKLSGKSDGLCYIDLTGCKAGQDVNDVTFSDINPKVINENCLVFLPVGATSDATNVVCKQADETFVCENLSLTRANGVPFYSPYEFKAKNITVDYAINSNLAGLVLPFDYQNDDVYLATFGGVDSEGYINLSIPANGIIPANTPFITQLKQGKTAANISLSNNDGIVVKPSVVTPTSCPNNSGWTYSGSYRTVTNNSESSYNIYGFASNQLKWFNNGVSSFKPFTGFFVQAQNGTQLAGVRNSLSEVANSVEFVDADNVNVVVSSNAITVNGNNANVSVASVNGISLFSGVINGSKTIEVNPGVYVVNGNKVVVK